MAAPAGLAPACSESKSDALLLSYGANNWFPRPDLHQLCGFHKAECYCYNTKGIKMAPRRGLAPRSAVYETAVLLLNYQGLRNGPSAWICTTALTGYEPGALLLSYGGMENGAPCRCCPDVSSLEDSHVTVTSMTHGNWSLESVSRRPVRFFKPLLIYLSHPAWMKLVPQRGIAPRSAGYRPAALLLSYRGN
jgi:hypothetical protein